MPHRKLCTTTASKAVKSLLMIRQEGLHTSVHQASTKTEVDSLVKFEMRLLSWPNAVGEKARSPPLSVDTIVQMRGGQLCRHVHRLRRNMPDWKFIIDVSRAGTGEHFGAQRRSQEPKITPTTHHGSCCLFMDTCFVRPMRSALKSVGWEIVQSAESILELIADSKVLRNTRTSQP